MPILSIRHITCYRYRNPAAIGEHRMTSRPRVSAESETMAQLPTSQAVGLAG
jgi:hypothetical protein